MKNKNMEIMKNQEIIIDNENAFRRLLDRQVFPWENQIKTVNETILTNARLKARETLSQLQEVANIKGSQIIEKISGRAESWKYGEYLEHTRLWAIPLLRNF